ncbi:hypothetical protein Tco_1333828, partial [Tanacetum coccineum]
EARIQLSKEQLAILADTGEKVDSGLDCDEIPTIQASFMANLSSCDSEVPSEVPYSNTYPNDMINQDVQEMPYSEQTHVDDFPDNEINSDSSIIPYSQYLQES